MLFLTVKHALFCNKTYPFTLQYMPFCFAIYALFPNWNICLAIEKKGLKNLTLSIIKSIFA